MLLNIDNFRAIKYPNFVLQRPDFIYPNRLKEKFLTKTHKCIFICIIDIVMQRSAKNLFV